MLRENARFKRDALLLLERKPFFGARQYSEARPSSYMPHNIRIHLLDLSFVSYVVSVLVHELNRVCHCFCVWLRDASKARKTQLIFFAV